MPWGSRCLLGYLPRFFSGENHNYGWNKGSVTHSAPDQVPEHFSWLHDSQIFWRSFYLLKVTLKVCLFSLLGSWVAHMSSSQIPFCSRNYMESWPRLSRHPIVEDSNPAWLIFHCSNLSLSKTSETLSLLCLATGRQGVTSLNSFLQQQ